MGVFLLKQMEQFSLYIPIKLQRNSLKYFFLILNIKCISHPQNWNSLLRKRFAHFIDCSPFLASTRQLPSAHAAEGAELRIQVRVYVYVPRVRMGFFGTQIGVKNPVREHAQKIHVWSHRHPAPKLKDQRDVTNFPDRKTFCKHHQKSCLRMIIQAQKIYLTKLYRKRLKLLIRSQRRPAPKLKDQGDVTKFTDRKTFCKHHQKSCLRMIIQAQKMYLTKIYRKKLKLLMKFLSSWMKNKLWSRGRQTNEQRKRCPTGQENKILDIWGGWYGNIYRTYLPRM